MQITRYGANPSRKPPADYFTGDVRMDPVITLEPPLRIRALHVFFEPGARTAWHTHPFGQTLYVTSGLGWVQREGAPIEEIRQGDVVWIPPNEKHWHGASAANGMSHIAMQEEEPGKVTNWLEKVSDADYAKGVTT